MNGYLPSYCFCMRTKKLSVNVQCTLLYCLCSRLRGMISIFTVYRVWWKQVVQGKEKGQ